MTAWLSRHHALLTALLLALAVLAVGLPTLDKGLFGDDLAAAHAQAHGGLAALSPLADFASEAPSSYWARQLEIRRLTARGAFAAEQYRPPLPTLLHRLQAGAFGGWLAGYHLVSLALHGLLVWACWLVARRLGLTPLAATGTAGIVALHPLLAPALMSLGGQRYVLAAIAALMTVERGLAPGRDSAPARGALAWFIAGLLSDLSALSALAILWVVPAPGLATEEGAVARHAQLRKSLGVAALVVLAFRLLMPFATGAHDPDGAYQQAMIAWFLSIFGAGTADLALMFAFVPPPVILLLPVTGLFAGLLGPVFLVAAFFRAFLRRSVPARAGLAAALVAWALASTGPMRLEDAVLPVTGFALVIVDAASALGARWSRFWRGAILAVLALTVVPSAVWYNHAVQDLTGGYAITSRRLAEQLDATLPPLEPNARLLLVNAWGGASFLPQEWRLLTGRGDVEVRILTHDPEQVPYGLPLPDLWHTRWVLPYTRWKGADTEVRVRRLEPATLQVELVRGVYMASPGDFAPDGEFIGIPRERIEVAGMTVTPGPFRENLPAGFRFTFTPDFSARQTIVRVWRNGRWEEG